jgi:hypothetical protein
VSFWRVSPLARVRHGSAAVVVVAAAIAVGGFGCASGEEPETAGQPARVAPPDATGLEELRRRALTWAAQHGDPSPRRAWMIAGRRRDVAERLVSLGGLPAEGIYYVVALEGDFIGYPFSLNPGARGRVPPRGRYMLLAHSVRRNRFVRWMLSDKEPDLEQFGKPITLPTD